MKRLYLTLITLLPLLALGIWLSQHTTLENQRIELGASPAARINHYLAMEYFLREQNIATEVLPSLTRLTMPTSEQQTLIILSHDVQLINKQHAQLLDWVAHGGHLVLSAQHEALDNTHQSLLSHLGIKKYRVAELDDLERRQEGQVSTAPDTAETRFESAQLTRLYLENEQSPAYLAFNTQYHLEDTDNRAYAWANSPVATHLLQLSYGQGLVTVLNDFNLWQNSHIDQYDHAWLLWYLSQDSQVRLFNPPSQQGFFKLLWHYYAVACMLLLALLLLGAWHAAPRFAAMQSATCTPRRQLSEHIQAGVLFNLRYKGQRSLLLSLQKDIKQRAQQRFPGFSSLAVAEQWQVLRQLSRQPVSLISHSMRPPATKKLSALSFTQHVANLQQLRNAL